MATNSVTTASEKKGIVHGANYFPGITDKEGVASGVSYVKTKVKRGSEYNEPADQGPTKPGLPIKPASPSPSPSPTPPHQRLRAGKRREGTGGKAVRGGRKGGWGVEGIEKKQIRWAEGKEQEGIGGLRKGPPALCACLPVAPDIRNGGVVIRTAVGVEGAVNTGNCRKQVIAYLDQFTRGRSASFLSQVDYLLRKSEHTVDIHERSLLKLADEHDKAAVVRGRLAAQISDITRRRNALALYIAKLKEAGLRKKKIHIANLNRLAIQITELRTKCAAYLEDKKNAEAKTEATEERLHLAIEQRATLQRSVDSNRKQTAHANRQTVRSLNAQVASRRDAAYERAEKQRARKELAKARAQLRVVTRLLSTRELAYTRSGEKRKRGTQKRGTQGSLGELAELQSDSDTDAECSEEFKKQRAAQQTQRERVAPQTVAGEWEV